MSDFKVGDKVKVSNDPGVGEAAGSGYVSPNTRGTEGVITALAQRDSLCHTVKGVGVNGKNYEQLINPAHLTLIKPEPEFKMGDRVHIASNAQVTGKDGTASYLDPGFPGNEAVVVSGSMNAYLPHYPNPVTEVRLTSGTLRQYVDTRFLTPITDEPRFKVGDFVQVCDEPYAAWDGEPRPKVAGAVAKIADVDVEAGDYGVRTFSEWFTYVAFDCVSAVEVKVVSDDEPELESDAPDDPKLTTWTVTPVGGLDLDSQASFIEVTEDGVLYLWLDDKRASAIYAPGRWESVRRQPEAV